MNDKKNGISFKETWFVRASYGGSDDQMPRLLSEGIWGNGYEDKLLDMVKSTHRGDSSYELLL